MATDKSIPCRNLIQGISETLSCSQRLIARLIGMDPHSLSNNKDTPITENSETTRKLVMLYELVVRTYGRGGLDLRPEAIIEILESHVFEDLKGRTDSVLSALHQEKYPIETLLHIAEISYQRLQEHNRQSTIEPVNAETAVQTQNRSRAEKRNRSSGERQFR